MQNIGLTNIVVAGSPINIQGGVERLKNMEAKVSYDNGRTWTDLDISGADNGDGQIDSRKLDQFLQNAAEQRNGAIKVKVNDNGRIRYSTWAPRAWSESKAAPQAKAESAPVASAPRSAEELPAGTASSVVGQPSAPAAEFQTGRFQVMAPGQLAREFAAQQLRLKGGTMESRKDGASAPNPDTLYRPVITKNVVKPRTGMDVVRDTWQNRGKIIDNVMGLFSSAVSTYDYFRGEVRSSESRSKPLGWAFANMVARMKKGQV